MSFQKTRNMITPEQFLKEFKEKFTDWSSFQGNKFKNVRESWIAANFLRTYNRLYNLNYSLPLPIENNLVPDIKGCVDESNDKALNFEIGEVLLDGAARSEKYKNLINQPAFKEIESNPEAIKVIRTNLLNLLKDKLLRDYGKVTFLLLYFNPSADAGEELFFDKEQIIENFMKEDDFVNILNTDNKFQEIWLLTGRIIKGYSQIISIFPEVKVYESYKR
ncbi:MAG: hypothetical protein COS48_05570 [Candidatus Omnitrophica bacterium CG03_land_8_20_14_0_80_43_22]|nr:MAG: hypothetical protein COS48_05570 [Candidatus Omnitrophica bacterium CG03_land_8_20_14_0_80_43_22]